MDKNKLLSINSSDRVLEIGPGGEPYPRSDVFLEIEIVDEDVAFNSKVLIINKVKYGDA